MLTTITPAVRVARDIESRAIEAQLIHRLVDLADHLAGQLSPADADRFHHQREDVCAVLRGARAMIADLVSDLSALEDRALALQEPLPARSGPEIADAA